MRSVQISVEVADATEVPADVLALKYAQSWYGIDAAVSRRLTSHGIKLKPPSKAAFTLCDSDGAVGARQVLFAGVEELGAFGYPEIRQFAHDVLSYLATSRSSVQRLAMTLHGPGYGLDELEAFRSQLAGLVDALSAHRLPRFLESIQFVERDPRRAERMRSALRTVLPDGTLVVEGRAEEALHSPVDVLRSVGRSSNDKPHVFVAMPFSEDMSDTFHYGIQQAVNSAGMLCERADNSAFTGDVLDWVKRRIATAKLVIADLSSANPNVYLEVGYAWGREVPTVLLAKQGEELKFDVKGQRCILYKSIKNLEEKLTSELQALRTRS